MNRGDIWQVDLGGKAGTRPAVVLTRQKVLEYLNYERSVPKSGPGLGIGRGALAKDFRETK